MLNALNAKQERLGLQSVVACDGIHPERVAPASPRRGDVSWVGSLPRFPVPESLHLLTLQLYSQPYPV